MIDLPTTVPPGNRVAFSVRSIHQTGVVIDQQQSVTVICFRVRHKLLAAQGGVSTFSAHQRAVHEDSRPIFRRPVHRTYRETLSVFSSDASTISTIARSLFGSSPVTSVKKLSSHSCCPASDSPV